jgi:flavin-dependent dehydrogenase
MYRTPRSRDRVADLAMRGEGGTARIPDECDVAVIGGGPAGSSLAIPLALAGRRVVLCERDRFPRDKLCGEFLSGESRNLLDRLGCMDKLEGLEPAVIHKARFTAPCGAICEVDLPAPAIGISRRALDEILIRHAASSGVTVLEGVQVRSVGPWEADSSGSPDQMVSSVELRVAGREGSERLQARLVVGAHGRRTSLDRTLGRAFVQRRHPHVGFKRHHRPIPGKVGERFRDALDGFVEVHTFDGGYCGLSHVEAGVVNVCMLVTESFLRGLSSTGWDDVCAALCRANPHLAKRLDALEPTEAAVHTVAGVPFSPKERVSGSVLFVGDAAGMIAPFCGDGQAMAFRSARLLTELILDFGARLTPAEHRALARRWERRWRKEFGLRMRLGRWLQPIFLRGTTANIAVRVARRLPVLTRRLVRATRGA